MVYFVQIQAWWRGVMVRKGLGKFEELRLQKKGKNSAKDKKDKKKLPQKPKKKNLKK